MLDLYQIESFSLREKTGTDYAVIVFQSDFAGSPNQQSNPAYIIWNRMLGKLSMKDGAFLKKLMRNITINRMKMLRINYICNFRLTNRF